MYLKQSQIQLNDVRIYAYHGVMDQERKVGGWYKVSLTIDYPCARALETDDVADTLNYATVLEVVRKEMKIPSNLLEHVAGRIARSLFESFPLIESITIRLTKENPPMGDDTLGASVILSFNHN